MVEAIYPVGGMEKLILESARLYPRAPLVEAVFEVTFPGEPAIECHRDDIFSHVRKDMPQVFVPARQSATPTLEPYRFQCDDESRILLVSINKLAFITKRYQGFAAFKAEALRYLEPIGKRFDLGLLNRTGLRFVNLIPFVREGGMIPISRFLNLRLELGKDVETAPQGIEMSLMSATEGGQITTRILNVVSPEGGKEALVLDFDYAKTQDLQFSNLGSYLQESHDHAKRLFENITTDGYKAYMRGDVIE